MANQGRHFHVGDPAAYKAHDLQKYGASEISHVRATHGINTAGYMDTAKIVNELYAKDNQERTNDRMKYEPGFAATFHGNKPSRGAKIDAMIAKEEAELLARKLARKTAVFSKDTVDE